MTTLNHQNLDLTLYMRSSLLKDSALDTFQRLLRQLAPRWASRLYLYRFRESYPSIDITVDGALQELALTKGLERGMLFDRLQELTTSPKTSRRFGSLELRGANQQLTVVLQFDDWVFQPVGTAWIAGNSISIQVRAGIVEEKEAVIWIQECFSSCCRLLTPFYGFACATEEYESKNIFQKGGMVKAIGINLAKHLPGLYWLNYFGEPYVKMMGEPRLMSAPTHDVTKIDSTGVLFKLCPTPVEWLTPQYKSLESSVVQHLGKQYFFSRDHQDRNKVSPFELPEPHPSGKVQGYVDLDSVVRIIRIP